MAKKLTSTVDTSGVETKGMSQVLEDLHQTATSQKRSFSRKWYDNNFFDDGYHFRYVHRTTGRIADLSKDGSTWYPKRAIPKASRQIRGIANLLLSFDFHPVVYPEKVNKLAYVRKGLPPAVVEDGFGKDLMDLENKEVVQDPQKLAYEEAVKMASNKATNIGHWIEEEWRRQEIMGDSLPLMILLAMKNSVSFMQVWLDPVSEDIVTSVYDAFDIDIMGNYNKLEDSPFVGKVIPKLTREIKANEYFDDEAKDSVQPDNKLAGNETKEAYLMNKYGYPRKSETAGTSLMREYFIKETLDSFNMKRIKKQENADLILKSREKGDTVIRHTFTATEQTLLDEYIPQYSYPFVDFRMEPGALYQVAQIERFISLNKSYDSIISRLERYFHTMNVGLWTQRQGEQFKVNNRAGGQVIKYKGVPPTQAKLSPIPAYVFGLLQEIKTSIEEQGVTTTALGKIPKGVKANAAIESLKASELANMTTPIKQLQRTITGITEKFIELAGDHYVVPREVEILEKGEANYFSIVGEEGARLKKRLKDPVKQDLVIVRRDQRVRVDVESGGGFTVEGKRNNMIELSRFLFELAESGMINPESLKLVVKKLIETYQFGSVGEFMEAMEMDVEGGPAGDAQEDQKQIDLIKIGVVEALKDLNNASQGEQSPEGQV